MWDFKSLAFAYASDDAIKMFTAIKVMVINQNLLYTQKTSF